MFSQRLLAPPRVIDKSDRLALAQTPHKAGYDPNRIVQQLTICRITDVTFHTGRIHSDLAPLFQTFLIGPTHQHPVDLLPGGVFHLGDVLLKDALGGSVPVGKATKGAETLRVAQMKGELFIRKLVRLFDQSAAQHLIGCQTSRTVPGAGFVTHIL